MVKKNLSNKWFIVSVVITILLIFLLVWGLLHSYRTLKNFESGDLALEEASGELLLYTKELEMSVQMAAATGDLRWQETYDKTKPDVEKVLTHIPELIDLDEFNETMSELQIYFDEIYTIEQQAFDLISQGQKDDASRLVSGWDYTKNQLLLTETIKELTNIMDDYTANRMALEEKLTSFLLISVFISLTILVVSWYISIKTWQMGFREIRKKEDKITYLSYHDSLTGLYNRRYFEKELRRLKRQLPVTIIICDANRLKEFNDTLGHNIGDQLLIEIANILKHAVQEQGIVSRWGGDEFGIILPFTDDTGANEIITRINQGCQNSDFEAGTPSISIGFAVKKDKNQNMNRIFTEAETRMYKQKASSNIQR